MVTRMHVEPLPNGYVRVYDRVTRETHLVVVNRQEVPNYFEGYPPTVIWNVTAQYGGRVSNAVKDAVVGYYMR